MSYHSDAGVDTHDPPMALCPHVRQTRPNHDEWNREWMEEYHKFYVISDRSLELAYPVYIDSAGDIEDMYELRIDSSVDRTAGNHYHEAMLYTLKIFISLFIIHDAFVVDASKKSPWQDILRDMNSLRKDICRYYGLPSTIWRAFQWTYGRRFRITSHHAFQRFTKCIVIWLVRVWMRATGTPRRLLN